MVDREEAPAADGQAADPYGQALRVDQGDRKVAVIVGCGASNLARLAMAIAREGYATQVIPVSEAGIDRPGDGIDVVVGGPPCSIEPMGAERLAFDRLLYGWPTHERGGADGTPVFLVIDEAMPGTAGQEMRGIDELTGQPTPFEGTGTFRGLCDGGRRIPAEGSRGGFMRLGAAMFEAAILRRQVEMIEKHRLPDVTDTLRLLAPRREPRAGGPPKETRADWKRSVQGGKKSRKLR